MIKTITPEYIRSVQETILPLKAGIKKKAKGKIKYDYLVPSGYYKEQWDWDAFFMCLALIHETPTEAIYLKNWVFNFVEFSDEEGYTPGVVTIRGRDKRLNQMKPLIAQGAYIAAFYLHDFSWIEPIFERLKKIVTYREKNMWNKKYDLGVWFNAMESGADNNVTILNFPEKSVLATDLNTFVYLEYLSMAKIAKKLDKNNEADFFVKRANKLKKRINDVFWDRQEGAYFNVDSRNGHFIKRTSYSSVHPLWAKIAPPERAKTFIRKYMLDPQELYTKYGLRTLSKRDLQYNNENMIKPHSNWQGPIWPIANYFYVYALLNYGYQKQALEIASRVAQLCMNDIKETGGMHEDYDAETGKPLAAPNFVSWNLLVPIYLSDSYNNTQSIPSITINDRL